MSLGFPSGRESVDFRVGNSLRDQSQVCRSDDMGAGYAGHVCQGAQLLRGEIVSDGSPTDGVPAPGLFVVLRGEPSRKWWWMVRGAAFAGDDRPGPTEQDVPGYGVLDAGAGFTAFEWLEISVLGRNLLNRSYLASSDEDAVLAPGRSIQLVLRGRL